MVSSKLTLIGQKFVRLYHRQHQGMIEGSQIYHKGRRTQKVMKGTDLLSHEEKFILDTLRSVAKLLGDTTAHREYQRRALYARKMAAKGDMKAAEKEYEILRTKFSQMWKFGNLLLRVYQEGFHNGALHAGTQGLMRTVEYKDGRNPSE